MGTAQQHVLARGFSSVMLSELPTAACASLPSWNVVSLAGTLRRLPTPSLSWPDGVYSASIITPGSLPCVLAAEAHLLSAKSLAA